MREKLNANPMLQAALLGVLAIVVGFMLFTRMSGPEAPPAESTPLTDPSANATAPAVDPAAAAAAGSGASTAQSGQAPAGGEGFVAGPGLPADVADAYKDNKVIALLIVRGNGSDDQRLEPMVEELRSRGDTAVFIVKAFDIAKYSRIAQGVKVQRTPALIVVQPKRLTEGPLPTASVSYGFRGKASVDQAIRDALYEGRQNLPYYPE